MGPSMMGPGMMGGWGTNNPNAEQITIDEAAEAVERYLRTYGEDLALAEVMEFAWNFYAEAEEESTGIHAMELLIDKYTGQVYPEMGPNMMWNTKYGMMGPGMMGGFGWWWFMPIFFILFWGLVIWGIVALVRGLSGSRDSDSSTADSALEVLKRRYAKGEIDKKEYEEKKKDLV